MAVAVVPQAKRHQPLAEAIRGLVQATMIGIFTTGPVIMLGVLKFARDYWTPPASR